MAEQFLDRANAGRLLASMLTDYANRPDVLVLALPRGGVPVAFEVAQALEAPLDVFLVRKLGVPGHAELALGAIAAGGAIVLNERIINSLGIPSRMIDAIAADEQFELERRGRRYRSQRPMPDIRGRTVILVDDGLATGATMRVAAAAIRPQRPARIVAAVPVAARETCDELRGELDEVVCARTPAQFEAVGCWYQDFAQTTDEEVRDLLARALRERPALNARTAG